MELYLMATGVKDKLDLWETILQGMLFNLPYKDAKGKAGVQGCYGMLEPINLYRYIFPKEYRDRVLKTFDLPNDPKYPGFNLQATALRKIMKAKKIPKPDSKALALPFIQLPIAVQGIGIKEDPEVTLNGNTHEGL